MTKLTLALAILSAAVLSGCTKEIKTNVSPLNNEQLQSGKNNILAWETTSEFVPGELLIKFKAGAPQAGRSNALARIKGKIKQRITTNAMKHFDDHEGLHLVATSNGVLEAIQKIKGLPEVEYAEPNYIYKHGDPVLSADKSGRPVPLVMQEASYNEGNLWGMLGDATTPQKNAFGSQAGEAWSRKHTGSHSVYVGIIDEGIRFDHPDLDQNIWRNPYESVDGKDNDGNGYVDDIRGWDFVNGDNSIYDGADNHGTHVAGTIGAKANNSVPNFNQGVVGVNWDVTMISAKFLNPNGGTTLGAIQALDYFTDLKIRHKLNIVATNNSWSGGGFSQALLDAITRSAKKDILFIASAGNGNASGVGQNNDNIANYPSNYNTLGQTGGLAGYLNDSRKCNYDAVIAVAAIDEYGGLAPFSNFGAKTVDLGAPGVRIWSTIGSSDLFAGYNGTSMAAPHVTGGAALHAAYSTQRGDALKKTILNAAKSTPTPSLSGKTVTSGRLNVSGF